MQEEDDVLATLMKYEQGCATEPFSKLADIALYQFDIKDFPLKVAMNGILEEI